MNIRLFLIVCESLSTICLFWKFRKIPSNATVKEIISRKMAGFQAVEQNFDQIYMSHYVTMKHFQTADFTFLHWAFFDNSSD